MIVGLTFAGGLLLASGNGPLIAKAMCPGLVK
jgi:hypothetical protein